MPSPTQQPCSSHCNCLLPLLVHAPLRSPSLSLPLSLSLFLALSLCYFFATRADLPVVPADLSGGVELVSDVIAATIHKAAELHAKTSDGANATVPKLLTTEGRKQILADRKEAARLEMERVEREAAKKELADAIEAAKAARDAAPPAPQEGGATAMKAASALLDKPMKRAKKAVDFPEADMAAADGLKQELDDAKKEREVAERLERERIEREAAQEELANAIMAAKAARDAAPPAPQEGGATAMKAASALLDKPMKRAKKAVDFPEADMAAADGLKQELDDAKKEREVAERLERERIEREAAQEELKEAIASCETSRDPAAVVKALKRCKKAVDADADLITKGEGLKAACDEEKAAAAKAAKEEAAAAKQAEKEKAAAAKAEAEAAKAAKAAEETAAKAKAAEEASAAKAAAEASSSAAAEPEPEAAAPAAAE